MRKGGNINVKLPSAGLDDFALTFFSERLLAFPAKLGFTTSFVFLQPQPAEQLPKEIKKARALQFIILIHKQSLMFMTGVVTCLRQHYVCFTRPLSSPLLRPLAAFPRGSGMFNQLLTNKKRREQCLARRSACLTGIAIKPSH